VTSPQQQGVGVPEGHLNTALGREVVRIRRRYVGRGPASVTAFFHHDMLVVVMEDTMTKAEQSLAIGGNARLVHEMRLDLDRAMKAELTLAVEGLTGCRVKAFLSASQLEPDITCQVYRLDRPIDAASGEEAPSEPVQ
jgi:uncharacterized protein YbcI